MVEEAPLVSEWLVQWEQSGIHEIYTVLLRVRTGPGGYKRRPVSKNRKVGTVDRDPRTARRYAPNERRRPRDARLQRGMVSLDVERGRVAVARVRTGVSTRHRRLACRVRER